MVILVFWLGFFSRRDSAEYRYYRFRTSQVYLPRLAVSMNKNATHTGLPGPRPCLRRYRAPSDSVELAACAAQYFLSDPPLGRMAVGKADSSVADLGTTLVLEPELADFSTDASNSALIFEIESSQRHVAPFRACLAAKKK
jgi:hypothetical protein